MAIHWGILSPSNAYRHQALKRELTCIGKRSGNCKKRKKSTRRAGGRWIAKWSSASTTSSEQCWTSSPKTRWELPSSASRERKTAQRTGRQPGGGPREGPPGWAEGLWAKPTRRQPAGARALLPTTKPAFVVEAVPNRRGSDPEAQVFPCLKRLSLIDSYLKDLFRISIQSVFSCPKTQFFNLVLLLVVRVVIGKHNLIYWLALCQINVISL